MTFPWILHNAWLGTSQVTVVKDYEKFSHMVLRFPGQEFQDTRVLNLVKKRGDADGAVLKVKDMKLFLVVIFATSTCVEVPVFKCTTFTINYLMISCTFLRFTWFCMCIQLYFCVYTVCKLIFFPKHLFNHIYVTKQKVVGLSRGLHVVQHTFWNIFVLQFSRKKRRKIFIYK